MRQFLRRVGAAFCLTFALFALTACGSSGSADETMSAQDQTFVMQMAESTLRTLDAMTDEELALTLESAQKSKDTALSAGITSWQGVKEDVGALVSIDSITPSLTDDGYGADIEAPFEKRGMSCYIEIDDAKSGYTAMSFNPDYTVGEKLTKAALNTVMGMGTVFAVLIFISFLIGCFKYIHVWEEKRNAQKAPEEAPAPVQMAAEPEEEENLADDLELVAVITAAIAASEDVPADGLVVRSIKRAPVSKWKRS